jgi:hypothetical protein
VDANGDAAGCVTLADELGDVAGVVEAESPPY